MPGWMLKAIAIVCVAIMVWFTYKRIKGEREF